MGRIVGLLVLTLCLGAACARRRSHGVAAQSVDGESEPSVEPGRAGAAARRPAVLGPQTRDGTVGRAGGGAPIAALEEGVQSSDREMSFRSRHALDIVREHDFQRRLRAFAAGQDAQETYELPGWALFRKEVGDGLEARRLFVEMQQAEPELLQALERSPERAVESLVERLEEIQQRPALGQKLHVRIAGYGRHAAVRLQSGSW